MKKENGLFKQRIANKATEWENQCNVGKPDDFRDGTINGLREAMRILDEAAKEFPVSVEIKQIYATGYCSFYTSQFNDTRTCERVCAWFLKWFGNGEGVKK